MADEQHSLQAYVSDILALERHVRVPFEAQAKDDDFSKFENAASILTELMALSQQHIDALERCLEDLGGHAASPLKTAVASFEGFFAGTVDKLRKTKVSKAMRDDYTALALCTASYTMLHATATGLGEITVSNLAQAHLADYAECLMDIGQALPAVVVDELRETGLTIDGSAVQSSLRAIELAWTRPNSVSRRSSETGTVDTGRTGTLSS